MHQLWIDLYSASFFLHGSSAAEEIKDAQIKYEENFDPDHSPEDESA
jgi:hypothetical protein